MNARSCCWVVAIDLSTKQLHANHAPPSAGFCCWQSMRIIPITGVKKQSKIPPLLAGIAVESLITTNGQRDQQTDGPAHWAPSPPTASADLGGNQSGRSQRPFRNRPKGFRALQRPSAALPALAFFPARDASHWRLGGGLPQGWSAWR